MAVGKEDVVELWKTIEGTDGMLEVSSEGRVKSNLRDGRILKPTRDTKGYARIRVTLNRQKRSYKVHRLVAMAFIENPEGKPQVNHIDGDKSNNRVSNLEWVSNKENAHHAIKNGLFKNTFDGARRENERRKKPVIAKNIKTGECAVFDSVSAAEHKIGTKHVSAVLKGKRKTAAGCTFEYLKGGDASVAVANSRT